jgi:hypothetical protein
MDLRDELIPFFPRPTPGQSADFDVKDAKPLINNKVLNAHEIRHNNPFLSEP